MPLSNQPRAPQRGEMRFQFPAQIFVFVGIGVEDCNRLRTPSQNHPTRGAELSQCRIGGAACLAECHSTLWSGTPWANSVPSVLPLPRKTWSGGSVTGEVDR